ncbi:hypothetical protein AAFF_G00317370 [Aldrovandia affinis]|uniref:AH domain-containing protein n=1 Tax=Aldrovandia affinis TaxID=143900 RepID=A0AAD7R7Y1_9TELE|nr:hypothetical protein AAFF_G00317370 [Aldrovandia affinis]
MSDVSSEADAGRTQTDDPRVDTGETVSDNEDTLSGTEERQNVNEETLNDNEDGRISAGDGRVGAGDEYEDVQIDDEDGQPHNKDNQPHNEDSNQIRDEDNQAHAGEAVNDEDALKGSIGIPTGAVNVQSDTEEAEAEREMSAMAEDCPRSSAAEISVTSNGEAEEINTDVFQAPSLSAGMSLSDTCVISSSYGSATEGIIESGPYKGSVSQPTSPVVYPSSVVAGRLARAASDSQTEQGRTKTQTKSGAVVLADDLKNPAMEKLELVRKWSINTYKCTRQILSEKLGRGSRTVDLELESQIEILRDNKRKYEHVVKLAQTLASQLFSMVQTQRQLGDAFADLSLKSLELHEEFGFNADTQRLLSKNGETLLGAINFFIASVNTLVDKTIEDTLVNIKQYETARIEYDAYRTDLEELNLGPRDATTFLEENKVKVLHNQLVLFHNAIAAYYAGNQQQLEQTLKQFHIKLKMPGGDAPSWLEEQH